MTPTEYELIKEQKEILDNLYAFIINRENDKLLKELNEKNVVQFVDDKGNKFFISKSVIRIVTTISEFVLIAENKHKK